jgi:hypothetical protein
MKQTLFLLFALLLCGCQTPHPGPSLAPIKASIGEAQQAGAETTRHVSTIQRNTGTQEYKETRALQYFP